MQPESQAEIIRRLRTASGHLRAVCDLVEAGRPCEEVLHQLKAVRSALKAVGTQLLNCQLKQSEEIILNASTEKRAAELARLNNLLYLIVQQGDYESETMND